MRTIFALIFLVFIISLAHNVEAEQVTVVTAQNFDQVVKNSQQDVFLEFYAPWCGHCKNLAPIYEELAKKYSANSNIIIAKIDATENQIPGYPIYGYPTLKFFRKGNRPEVIDYSGERTVNAMVSFVENSSRQKIYNIKAATNEIVWQKQQKDEFDIYQSYILIMQDSQVQKQSLALGNHDKQAFFAKLKDNLLKCNMPQNQEEYVGDEHSNELAKNIMNRLQSRQVGFQEQTQKETYVEQQRGLDYRKKKRNYLNLFSVDRGDCNICKRHGKTCISYRACFNIESFRGIEIFQCMNCGCPMNSHNRLAPERSFSNLICKHVNRRYIQPQHFDFRALTAIYFVDRQKSIDLEIDIETFVSGLNEGSFNIFSFYELDIVDLQRIWMEKTLYSMKLEIPKDQYEEYHNFLDRFLEFFDLCGHEGMYNMRKRLSDPNDIEKLEFFMKLLNKVNKKLVIPFSQNQIAFVFLITAQRSNPYVDFKKFQKGTLEQMPKELQYFYSSKSKYHGIRDGILFFPQFFKQSVCSFVITQTLDDQMRDRMKINDTFKDLLDFNNFSIIKEDFSANTFEQQVSAFSFITDPKKFLQFCTNDGFLNLKIVSKIGPQSVTVLSQSMPNYYRVASHVHNQTLCDKLCPELFTNQRNLVIYRPLIVKSGLEEILGALWRVNDFVIVKRSYKRFTNNEALLLGQVEGIHPDNLNSYVAMMTDGFSLLILYSRPGAYAASKVMTIGCETGLRVRKSQIFTEVSIDHPMKSGVVFKEKLQMNFNNNFESYTEQNIFRSIRDLFDLEELVLQENSDDQSKNVFVDDDQNNVFLAQQPELKRTKITGDLRQQIVKDLAHENYNFYVYATPDEITTEQLTSIFMSDCTQVQQLYIVIKPLLNTSLSILDYVESIKTLLKRMKFTIVDGREYSLQQEQASNLIQLLSPFKLPENMVDSYTDFYCKHSIYILSLVKPGGKYEMKNFLKNYNFLLNQQLEIPSLIHELRPLLIPCLNVDAFRFLSKLFNPFLDSFDGLHFSTSDTSQNKIIPQQSEKIYLLNYILMSTFGVEIDEKIEYEHLNLGKSSQTHCHLKVQSKAHGQFEIRVKILDKSSRYQLDYYRLIGEYQLLSWYYSKVNQKLKQRCPVAYQFRVLHEERAKQGEFDQVFDCQEFCGRIFLLEIYHQIFQFGNDVFEKIKASKMADHKTNRETQSQFNERKQQEQLEQQMQTVAQIMEARSKIIAYFWGVKLAKFIKELELVDTEDFPNGYGAIGQSKDGFECRYKIKSDEYDGLHEVERKKYGKIIGNIKQYLKQKQEVDPQYDDRIKKLAGSHLQSELQASMVNQSFFMKNRSEDQRSVIERQITKYFEIIFGKEGKVEPSSILTYSLEQKNLRLLPSLIDITNLRILLDKEHIKQNFDGAGGGMQLDYNYEFNETLKKTKTINKIETELKKTKSTNQTEADKKSSKIPQNSQTSLKQPLNNYVLVYSLPAIQSKFRLVANVFYMLYVELRIQKQHNYFLTMEVFQEDELFKSMMQEDLVASQYQQQTSKTQNPGSMSYIQWFKERFILDKEKVVENLIKGFEGNFFLEEEVLQKIQGLNKENMSKKKPPIPDIINMWLYLICLEELDAHILRFNDIYFQEVQIQKQLMIVYQQMERCKDKIEQLDEFIIQEQQIQKQIVQLMEQRDKVDGFIISIFQFLLSDDFQKKFSFNSEETELQFNQIKQKEEKFNMDFYIEYIQNNLVHMDSLKAEEDMQTQLNNFFVGKQTRNFSKEFISSKRYYLPLEQGNNQKEWGKLDQDQIDDRMKIINDDQAEQNMNQLELFKNAPYMKDLEKDDIQQKWLDGMKNTQQGKFVDSRPDKKKVGIYVDTVKTMDKPLDEKIDSVIKKFMSDKMNNFTKTK